MARKRRPKNVEPKKPPEIEHKVPPAVPARHGDEKPEAPPPPRLEGTEVPDHMRKAQADAAQQAPRPVKLTPAKDELGHPADLPPVPPLAKANPVPRVIDQSERSPDPARLTRFKIRADEPFGVQPTRYVLARKGDKQGAIDHYLETTGIRAILETFHEGQAPKLRMSCKELPD